MNLRNAVTLVALLAVAVPVAAQDAVAMLVNADGESVGKVTFHQGAHGVVLAVDAHSLPPGAHGIHLHTVGSCTPDFTASKGHVNTTQRKHGLLNPDGPDSGDLPNLHVAADGRAKAEFYNTRIAVRHDAQSPRDVPALLDEDGAAVVIHANPDDHITQPIGGAGGRIACGVVESAPAD